MSAEQTAIADMQCWILRLAQKRWRVSGRSCARIFRQYDVFAFIEQAYGMLHLSGYERALDDVEEYLRRQGASL